MASPSPLEAAAASLRAALHDVHSPGASAGACVDAHVKQLLAAGGSVHEGVRACVWEALLGCPRDAAGEAALSVEVQDVTLDVSNQRVIRVDAERTRQDIPAFQSLETVARVARLLTHYVKNGFRLEAPAMLSPTPALRYKQGLNEVLAVFLLLPSGQSAQEVLSDGRVQRVFSRFVARFAPRIYASNDDEFTSLQCTFRLFRLLMLYHDPQLCAALDQHELPPELYATPWFLTLLSRGNPVPCVLVLWDFLLACVRRPGPAIFHFVALALLRSARESVLEHATSEATAADLPLIVSRLQLTSAEHTRAICSEALDLWVDTPLSFRRLLHNVSYSGGFRGKRAAEPLPISTALLARLESRVAVKISVDELLVGAASRFASPTGRATRLSSTTPSSTSVPALTQGLARLTDAACMEEPPRYVLLDCRCRDEYECGGRLPTAFHLDPALLQDPERLDSMLTGFAGLRGMHLALMGPGDISQWYHAPVLPPPVANTEPACALSPSAAAADASEASAPSAPDRASTPPRHETRDTSGAPTPQVAGAELHDGALYDYGVAGPLSSTARASAASSDADAALVVPDAVAGSAAMLQDEEYVAVRSGLDPLSANEEDDYARDDATRAFIYLFLQKGFTHVSEVEGGFTALHQHQAHFLDTLLVGHDPALCMVCSGGKAADLYLTTAEPLPDVIRPSIVAQRRDSGGSSHRMQARGTSMVARMRDALWDGVGAREDALDASEGPAHASVAGHRKRRYDALRSWFTASSEPSAHVAGPARTRTTRRHRTPGVSAARAEEESGDEVEIVLFSDGIVQGGPRPCAPSAASLAAAAAESRPSEVAVPPPVQELALPPARAPGRVLRDSGHVRAYPDLDDRSMIEGFDADGMPILSEAAWLDSQSDEMERAWHVRRTDTAAAHTRSRHAPAPRSRRGSKQASAPSSHVSAASASAPVTNLDEVVADAAVAAAKSAATLLRGVLTPPDAKARSSRPAVLTEHDRHALAALVSPPGARLPPPVPPVKQRVLAASSPAASKITVRTSQYMEWAGRKAAALLPASAASAETSAAPRPTSSRKQ